jgi:hypothetical protein
VKSEIEFDTPLVVTSDMPTTITVNVPVNARGITTGTADDTRGE